MDAVLIVPCIFHRPCQMIQRSVAVDQGTCVPPIITQMGFNHGKVFFNSSIC